MPRNRYAGRARTQREDDARRWVSGSCTGTAGAGCHTRWCCPMAPSRESWSGDRGDVTFGLLVAVMAMAARAMAVRVLTLWLEFPSGRAFGYTAFPDSPDGTPGYARGFVFDGERMYPAAPVEIPWLTTFRPENGDVGFTLRSELGPHRIEARTTTSCATAGRAALSTIAALNSGTADRDLFLHQGGARYTWDGESAYGMVERALPIAQVTVPERGGA